MRCMVVYDEFGVPLPQPSQLHPPPGLQSQAQPSQDREYDDYEYEVEQVRVLGGYIQRMPTIESLGSREVGSGSLASRSASQSHSGRSYQDSSSASNSGYGIRIPSNLSKGEGVLSRSASGTLVEE